MDLTGDNLEAEASSLSQPEDAVEKKLFRLTSEQKDVLKNFWDQGMRSASTPKLKKKITQAAAQINVEEEQVKNWIYGQHKRARLQNGTSVRRKQPRLSSRPETRPQKLYRYYRSREMMGKEQASTDEGKKLMVEVNKSWNIYKTDETRLNSLEKELQEKGPMDQPLTDLTDKQKMARVEKYLKKIEKYCDKLEEDLEYQTVVLTSNPYLGLKYTGNLFGRRYAADPTNRRHLVDFHFAAGGSMEGVPMPTTSSSSVDDVSNMRRQVREMLNKKYFKATKKATVEYAAIQSKANNVRPVNWPSDVLFQKTSCLGMPKLRKLWAARDEISFKVKDNNEEDGVNEQSGVSELEKDEDPDRSNNGGDDDLGDLGVNQAPNEDRQNAHNTDTGTNDVQTISQDRLNTDEGINTAPNEDRQNTDAGEMNNVMNGKTRDRKGKSTKGITAKGKRKKIRKDTTLKGTFIPEEIVGSRVTDNGLLFNVKWEGFNSDENTWEPESNLLGNAKLEKYKLKVFSKYPFK